MLWPREAGKFIAGEAEHVKIIQTGVDEIAKVVADSLQSGGLTIDSFKQNEVLPFDKGLSKEDLANWMFLIDSINFNFWTPHGKPKFTVSHRGKTRSGYLGMVLAVNRAIDEGRPMHDPKYCSELSTEELRHIFRSDTSSQIPLLGERIKVVHDVSRKLVMGYNGSFVNILKESKGSALELVKIVTENFESFNDRTVFNGQDVAIFKRAQILAADTWLLFCGQGLGEFHDLDKLTMFADYRVPQVLAYFGALTYSAPLMQKLSKEHLFKSGDVEEVEIRGCSIEAVEQIVQKVNTILKDPSLKPIRSTDVDYFLWDYRITHAKKLESVPYHKVRCIFY